jgi:hypothetical protein
MSSAVRYILTAFCLLVAVFCTFGVIASGEPGPNHHLYRIGYSVAGIFAVAAIIAMIAFRKR